MKLLNTTVGENNTTFKLQWPRLHFAAETQFWTAVSAKLDQLMGEDAWDCHIENLRYSDHRPENNGMWVINIYVRNESANVFRLIVNELTWAKLIGWGKNDL
jgi:hypothetical protein